MKKKQEQTKELEIQSVFPVNENLLNIISPAGIDFNSTHTSLGENIGKIFVISKYPFTADYGWLAPLCNLDGTSTTIEFQYTEPDRLIKIFDARIKELRTNQGVLKNDSEKKVNEKAISDLDRLIERISVQQEPVGYVNIMLHVQDLNEDKLQERIKKVSAMVGIQGCNLKLLKNRQGIALKAVAPYGIPDPDVSNVGLRNMPISTFIGGFPMANPGLNDDGGYYLGRTTNKRLVIINPWLRGKDRTNSNWYIQGVPGVGKSTALKNIFLMEYAFGTKLIIMDPESEYTEMTRHPDVNGDVINCAGGENGRINPLQARKTAVVGAADIEDSEQAEDYQAFSEQESDLALYIQQLRSFFKCYFGKEAYTSGIRSVLEECLIDLYRDFGIDWDTDIESVPNDRWPIMPDLYKKVEEKKQEEGLSNFRRENLEELHSLLFSVGEGADRLWNGPTTLEAKADFVDLDIKSLLEVDDNVKRAQLYNIVSWAWTELSKDRKQKVLFGIDEGYLISEPDYPEIIKYARNMSKRLRKYEGALMFITHALVDILDPAVRRYSQAIIDNACYKFIMGCDGKNLEDTDELFNLSEKELNILSQKNRGQGILFAGNIRLDLTVDVSDKFLEIMGSAGGR